MTASEIRERVTAAHEASHAAACVAMGATVTSIHMGFDGLALNGAAGEVRDHGISDPIDKAIIFFSGTVGASFCEGAPFGLVEPLRQTSIMRYFRETAKASSRKSAAGVERVPVPNVDLSDRDALRRHIRAGGSSDFHEAWKTLSKGRDRIEAESLFIAAQRYAMILVAAHLEVIRALADALLDRRLLFGGDIGGLLGGVKRVTREELAGLAASLEPD